MRSKANRYIHKIKFRAFNMTHETSKVFICCYSMADIIEYLRKRHGETATLIEFCNEKGTFKNPDYIDFRINTNNANQNQKK